MPKYKVSVAEIIYYEEKEVEARDEDEAQEKYEEMIGLGEVESPNSEYADFNVKVIK